MKRLLAIASVLFSCAALTLAQNSNSSTTDPSGTSPSMRERTVAPPRPTPTRKSVTKTSSTQAQPSASPKPAVTKSSAAAQVSPSGAVLAAFNSLLDGIRNSDVKAVTNAYQNSPRLLLFNYNGSVTKSWDQLKANREASYPQMREVKLEVRDLRVTMLSPTSAMITCQWTQSMVFNGVPETDTGRMTIVFRKILKDWKAVHLHSSPDNPELSRVTPPEPNPSETTALSSSDIRTNPTPSFQEGQNDVGIDIAYVNVSRANLRELPDSTNIIAQLSKGELLALIDRRPRGSWYNVIHVKRAGWMEVF